MECEDICEGFGFELCSNLQVLECVGLIISYECSPLIRKLICISILCMFVYTGLSISPSGISEFDCATTKTDTAERNISIGRESLQVFFCTRGRGVLPGSTAMG